MNDNPAAKHNAIVSFILDNNELEVPELMQKISKRWPNITIDEMHRAAIDASDRLVEHGRVQMAEGKEIQAIAALGHGLPEELSIEEVVEIRARQGNVRAVWLRDHPDDLRAILQRAKNALAEMRATNVSR